MSRTLQSPTYAASIVRNVHIYVDNGEILGGIFQNGSLTHAILYDLCPRFLDFTPPNTTWRIFHLNSNGSTGVQLPNDAAHLAPGLYIILGSDATPISVSVNPDSFPRRVLTQTGTSKLTARKAHFRQEVRARDDHCMITGQANPAAPLGEFIGLHAAHVFPQARERDWRDNGFSQYITDNSHASCIGTYKIDSPQNGLLLSTGIHQTFDLFHVSINPDDNYRIIAFHQDVHNVDGRTLEFECRDPQNPLRVSDDLLRWHFRMAVLANMRGATIEPVWEMDFPDGDMMGEILEGPYAAERMETELFHRLGPGEGIC